MQAFSKFIEEIDNAPDQMSYIYPIRPQFNPDSTKNGLCKKFIHGKCQKDRCQFSHDSSKIKPCHHFQNNACTKGEDCDFSHTKEKMPICKYLASKGTCINKGCPYKHVLKPCGEYEKGFCQYGKQCSLTHVPKKLCKNYMYGFCPDGPECPNAHPKLLIEKDKIFLEGIEGRPIVKCNQCSEIGHKKTNCYQLAELPLILEIYCFKCKIKHKSDECPLQS